MTKAFILGPAHASAALACGLMAGAGLVAGAGAQEAAPRLIAPGSVTYNASQTGAQAAFVMGSPREAGLYVIFARYAAGTKGAPHSHPDQRIMTVLSGTLYSGTGPVFDEAKAQALPPGSVLVIPPNALHWGWAKDGEVLAQEVGIGPTSNTFPVTR